MVRVHSSYLPEGMCGRRARRKSRERRSPRRRSLFVSLGLLWFAVRLLLVAVRFRRLVARLCRRLCLINLNCKDILRESALVVFIFNAVLMRRLGTEIGLDLFPSVTGKRAGKKTESIARFIWFIHRGPERFNKQNLICRLITLCNKNNLHLSNNAPATISSNDNYLHWDQMKINNALCLLLWGEMCTWRSVFGDSSHKTVRTVCKPICICI